MEVPTRQIFILLLICLKFLEGLDTLQLDDNFGQEKDFKKYIVQEDEKIFIDLNNHFRGNFLNFSVTSNAQSSQTALVTQLINQGSFVIQRPSEKKLDYRLRDPFKNPYQSVKLDATYSKGQNQYFMYVDESLKLIVLDISSYYSDQSNLVNKISSQSLFDSSFMSQQTQICAHLITLEPQSPYHLLFCLSNLPSQNATMVIIDMNMPSMPIFKYVQTPLKFIEVLEGQIIVAGLTQSGDYILIHFSTKHSSSQFSIYNLNRLTSKISLNQVVTSLAYRNGKITFDTLKITDITVSFLDHRVFIADYNIGIIITKIECVDKCIIQVLSLVQKSKVDKIDVTVSNSKNNNRIIAVVSAPPEILEIDIKDIYSPYIFRILQIKADLEEYLSMRVFDSNPSYIALQMMRIEDMRPIIRIYTRIGPLKSFGIEQLDYAGTYGSGNADGHFLKFVDFNHLIVKTSENLKIFKIRRHQLILDATDIMPEAFDETQVLSLNVKDYLENSLSVNVEVQFERKDSEKIAKQLPSQKDLQIYYSCGQFQKYSVNQTGQVFFIYSLDEVFSGPKNVNYTLMYKGTEDYNFLQARNPQYFGSPKFQEFLNLSDCSHTGLVRFSKGNYFDNQMICISRKHYKISFFDIIDDGDATIQANVFEKTSNKNEPRPSAFVIDSKKQLIFAFTISEIQDPENPLKKKVIWHTQFFKIYNILTWIRQEEMEHNIANLVTGYTIAEINPIAYNKYNCMGLIRFKAPYNGNTLNQFFAYRIDEPSSFVQSLKILSRVIIEFQGINKTEIIDMKVAETGNIWFVLNNGQIMEYQLLYRGLVDMNSDNPDNWFEYFMKLKFSMQNTKQVRAIEGWSGRLIIFQGQNEIVVHLLDQTRILMKANFTLPLSYRKADIDAFESNLAFSINHLGNVVYALEKNYLFVLYNDTRDVSTYYLIVYQINTQRHDAILLEMLKIESGISVDSNDHELNMQLYSSGDNFEQSEISVIIQTSNGVMNQKVLLHPQIEINFENVTRLDQLCQSQESNQLQLNYLLCPFNTQSCFNVSLMAENTGLLLKRNFNRTTVVVNQLNQEIKPMKYQDLEVIGALPTLQYFEGYNMQFEYRLISEQSDTGVKFGQKDKEGVLKATNLKEFNLKTQRRNMTIEFISKNNRLLDFFSFGDLVVILDQDGYFNVISDPKANIYVRVKSDTFLGCAPSLYTVFYDPYLMYQCEFTDNDNGKRIKFGITKIYTNSQQLNVSEENLDKEYMIFREGMTGLFVKKIIPTLELQVPVSQTCLYELPNSGESELNSITAVISYDIPEDIYQSVIIVYSAQFNHSQQLTSLNQKTRYISPARMDLNNFRVTAMEIIPDTDLLTLGILDYGILVYSLNEERVVKQLPLMIQTHYQGLNIKSIIMQDEMTFHLLLETMGVISVSLNQKKDDLESLSIETYFNFIDGETTSIDKIGQHPQGFTFLTSQPLIKDNQVTTEKIFRVRLFTYYASQSKKLLAGREFQDGFYCDKLKAIPYTSLLIRDLDQKAGQQNEMWNAFVCGEELQFFDFYVDLNLFLLEKKNKFNRLTQQIEISVWNQFSRQNLTVDIHFIQDNAVLSMVFPLFALFIILTLVIVCFVTQDICKKSERQKKEIQNKESSQSFSTTQRSESTQFTSFPSSVNIEENQATDYIYGNMTTAEFKRKSTLPGVQQLLD